jgi:DNA-binding CsgD family transcriptional regulator/uncharacterized membrane protein
MSSTMQSAAPGAWWIILLLSLLIAGYGIGFVVGGEASFPHVLAPSFRARPWGIFSHALFGALALLVGPLQFRRGLRARSPRLHRLAGRAYVGAALGTGATGLLMAPHSFGGLDTHLGFGVLAVLTVTTTWMGVARIRAGDVAAHRAWMLRSFALIFAGVMLRVEQPLLMAAHAGEFAPAYALVAWLCWVPNLAWAEWYLRRSARGLARRGAQADEREQFARLTERERDVLRLVAGGYSAPEIGEKLFISPKTVDTYKQRIGEKLGLTHRSEYVRFALKLGLLTG